MLQAVNRTVYNRIGLERYWYWVIGYWAIFADIGQYCYRGIFFHCNTQYYTDQTAVSSVHMFIKHSHRHHHTTH